MDREEILKKSRSENRDKDLYEKEVMIKAGNIASCTAAIFCLIFFTAEILLGHGTNYGLWAVMFSIQASGFTYKAIKLKKKHEIAIAIAYIVMTLMMSAAHIWQLIGTSAIL